MEIKTSLQLKEYINKMDLFEIVQCTEFYKILRVPGGYIYLIEDKAPLFVPESKAEKKQSIPEGLIVFNYYISDVDVKNFTDAIGFINKFLLEEKKTVIVFRELLTEKTNTVIPTTNIELTCTPSNVKHLITLGKHLVQSFKFRQF